MKKIVGILRPFDVQQQFYVYENGNKIDAVPATMDEINNVIFALIEKHDVHTLDLVGPKQYARGIVTKFRESEMALYSKNIIEINLV